MQLISKPRSQTGSVLLDLTVGVLLTGIVLAAATGLFALAARLERQALQCSTAVNLAQCQLEYLKGQPSLFWAALPLPCSLPWPAELEMPPDSFTVCTAVEAYDATSALALVTISITWRQPGQPGSFACSMLVKR